MKTDRLRRLREYIESADTTMEHIPAPVPPKPEEDWDGPTFDTSEMYRAYSRLPADLQQLAATSHLMCEDALDWQRSAATRALMARYVLVTNVVQRSELANQLDSLYKPRPVNKYLTLVEDEGATTPDEDLIAEVQRDVEDYVRRLWAARDRAAASSDDAPAAGLATPVEPPTGRPARGRVARAWAATATVMAAVCAVLLLWRHPAAPAAVARFEPINQAIQAGDMTMVVNYAERTDDAMEVHVQVINFGSESAPASLSLGEDGDSELAAGPTMVPARSTQHRVLRVRKDRDKTRPVIVRFEDTVSMELRRL